MSIVCVWASIDENGHGHGGKAGDQTGREVKIGNWYNFGQNYVLRFKDKSKAKKAVEIAKTLAKNNKVGYDQYQRTTLYSQMKENDWNPSKIAKCETDCSAFVAVNINAVGIKVSKDIWTGNMVQALKGTGEFTVLKGSKYTSTDKNLRRGDIIVNTEEHVIMACEDGSSTKKADKKAKKKSYSGKLPALIKHKDGEYIAQGDVNENVKLLKQFLNWYFNIDLTVNTKCGGQTRAYIGKFQKEEGLSVDHAFGKKCLAKAKKYVK